MTKMKELSYEQCKWICDPAQFTFETTKELVPLDVLIGQERAVKAIEFGMQVKIRGYNLYVSGPNGTGKASYTKDYINKVAKTEEIPEDWCYVFNFFDPTKPKAISFPTGKGRVFKEDVENLIEEVKEDLAEALSDEKYEKEKEEIIKKYKQGKEEFIQNLYSLAKEQDFEIKNTSTGIYFIPIIEGKAVSQEEYDTLDEAVKLEVNKRTDILEKEAIEVMKKIRIIEDQAKRVLIQLENKVALNAVERHFLAIQNKYEDIEKAVTYLKDMKQDVLKHLGDFVEEEADESATAVLPLLAKQSIEDPLLKYKVNLLIDHAESCGAPVIIDFHPTYSNLIGSIEYQSENGRLITDFTKIKPGLFHKANGGYLILRIQDVLTNFQSWETLKRVLYTEKIVIESIREYLGLVEMSSLQPEPIPMQVKVILLGSEYIYHLLYSYDEDFKKLFKIKCDFDTDMNRKHEHIKNLARFIKNFCEEEKQPHFSKEAVAKVIEYSTRLANHQERLTAQFHGLIEIVGEACTWANLAKREVVEAQDVEKAMEEKEYRSNSYEMRLLEMMQKNVLLVDTTSEVIGQVNGLAVLDSGDYSFGKPSKITATISMGRNGIINIEKQCSLSGKIHDKGVLVLTGYLGETYGQDTSFAMNAQLCFEQLYSGIEGDSASSAELYAILSNLADAPIKQSIAVTGSLNQKGEIQPVGGVNEKIEGFYRLCKARGLDGSHGVIIPVQNVSDLVLKDEIVDAVKQKLFHIYPVQYIGEGIEILTGIPAGIRDHEGKYTENSIHERVRKKILQYSEKASSIGSKKTKVIKEKKRDKDK